MSHFIPAAIRNEVALRANYCCEYCLIHEQDAVFSHEVDHVISLKHGGSSNSDNLAYACLFCNRNKGSDIATILQPERRLIRLFDPRQDIWTEHFKLDEGVIEPLSDIAEATIKVLNINHFERVIERRELLQDGRYPPQSSF